VTGSDDADVTEIVPGVCDVTDVDFAGTR